MNQIPTFLMKMQGFNFGVQNLFIVLGLCLLEFFNLFTMISFILSIFFVLFNDFVFGEMRVFFVQIGVNSSKIFKVLLLNSIIYGGVFIVNDLFIVPHSNVFLKRIGLELYKNKVFYSIKPKHIINIPEIKLNGSIASRKKNELFGCLIHLEEYKVFAIIEKLVFEKSEQLKLFLSNCSGKIATNYDSIYVKFSDGVLEANTEVITIPDKVAFFDLHNWEEVFIRIKIFLVAVLSSFIVFIMIFSNARLIKVFLSFLFLIIFGNAVSFIEVDWLTFCIIYFIIILYFCRVLMCLDF